jgi:hypothetical protein
MRDQPLEPARLVVELRTGRRVAVRQIQASDQNAVDRRLDVAAVSVVGIARETAVGLYRIGAAGENGDTIAATSTNNRGSMPEKTRQYTSTMIRRRTASS